MTCSLSAVTSVPEVLESLASALDPQSAAAEWSMEAVASEEGTAYHTLANIVA